MKQLWLSLLFVCALANLQGQTKVQLLTCYPGEEFFQLEGHSALRFIEPDGRDYVVNWGVFDFNTPNFAYRYTKGETDYLAATAPTQLFLDEYRHDNRCVVAQELNLTPEQTQRLKALVETNLQPENRVYRYNYIRDNCATRPLRIIEQALGDTLALGTPLYSGKSFRDAMRHYHTHYPWYQFGIDLALGSGIDQPITSREMSFSPVDLEQLVAGARTQEGFPIVTQTEILTGDRSYDATLGPTPWYAAPLFVCFCFLFITLLICYTDIKKHRVSRWFQSLVYFIFGLAGCVICFLIFVSSHEATSPNYLILWLNPLCLIAALGIWIRRWQKLLICYQFLNFALLLVLCVILLCGVQGANGAFYFLIGADAACSLTYLHIVKWPRTRPPR